MSSWLTTRQHACKAWFPQYLRSQNRCACLVLPAFERTGQQCKTEGHLGQDWSLTTASTLLEKTAHCAELWPANEVRLQRCPDVSRESLASAHFSVHCPLPQNSTLPQNASLLFALPDLMARTQHTHGAPSKLPYDMTFRLARDWTAQETFNKRS